MKPVVEKLKLAKDYITGNLSWLLTKLRMHLIVITVGLVATGFAFYGLDRYTDHVVQKVYEVHRPLIEDAYKAGYNKCKTEMALYLDKVVAEIRNECDLERAVLTEKRIYAIIKKSNPELTPAAQREYVRYITKYAKEYGISPILVASVIHRESNYRTKLTSNVGAAGPMQVWAKWHTEKLKRNNITKKDLYTIKHGIKIGCEVLTEYLRWEKGDFRAALYRYVGGQHHGYVRDIFGMCEFAFNIK